MNMNPSDECGDDIGEVAGPITSLDWFRAARADWCAGGEGQIVASENEIAFENACVVTPANATLVRDLTLRVPAGTNLLVTGPNGSGACSPISPAQLRT